MDLGLTGRTALVTGGTGGLGRATAIALAEEGARVVVLGRRADVAQELASELGNGSIGVAADLGDVEQRRAAVQRVRDEVADVDVLVLNGGGPAPGTAAELTSDVAASAVEALLLPHVDLVSAFVPAMRRRSWGRVVAIGSSGVQQPLPNLAASNIGRAALAGYLKTLAAEVATDGVTVNMVLPGRIDTDRVRSLDAAAAERRSQDVETVREASKESIPIGRYGDPAEFGAVVTFLASGPAGYVTGEQVRCDGGLVRHH